MKNLFALISILIASLTFGFHSHSNHSTLDVRIWDRQGFKMILNNAPHHFSNRFQRRGLNAGNHLMKIVRFERSPCGTRRVRRVLFKGYVHVPECSDVYVTLKSCGTLDTRIRRRHQPVYEPGCSPDYGYNPYYDQPVHEPPVYDPPVYGIPTSNGGGNCSPGSGSFGYGMSDYDFNQLLMTLDNEAFDDTKLSIAKSALINNSLYSRQVGEIMSIMTFDSNKLKFAKFAYTKTIDPQNYYIVNNEFDFSSSKRSLTNYINRT